MPGGGQPDSTTTTVDYPAWLQEYIRPLMGAAGAQFQQGAPAPYPGQTYAGFTPEQIKGQDYTVDFADSFSDTMQPAMSAWRTSMSGVNPYAKYVEGGNPYLDSMVKRAQGSMADTFNTDVMQGIRDESIASGQPIGMGYSTYGKNVDVGTENLLKGMGDVATSMYGGAYESDMNRLLAGEGMAQESMIKGMSLTPSMMSSMMMPGQMYSGVGAEKQLMEQMGIDEMIKQWYQPYDTQMSYLNDFARLFTGMSPGGTTTTTQPPGNDWMGALGSGMMGYGMASMFPAMGVNPWVAGGLMAAPYLFD